jgi:hypothetical protein
MNLNENIDRIKEVMGLNEVLDDIARNYPLYHFTPEHFGIEILKSDSIISGKRYDFISTTRDKNFEPFGKGLACNDEDDDEYCDNDFNIELVFDKYLLKTRYKVRPRSHYVKSHLHFNREERDENEYEERVFTKIIQPLHLYLVDVKYHGRNPEIAQIVNDYKQKYNI